MYQCLNMVPWRTDLVLFLGPKAKPEALVLVAYFLNPLN